MNKWRESTEEEHQIIKKKILNPIYIYNASATFTYVVIGALYIYLISHIENISTLLSVKQRYYIIVGTVIILIPIASYIYMIVSFMKHNYSVYTGEVIKKSLRASKTIVNHYVYTRHDCDEIPFLISSYEYKRIQPGDTIIAIRCRKGRRKNRAFLYAISENHNENKQNEKGQSLLDQIINIDN